MTKLDMKIAVDNGDPDEDAFVEIEMTISNGDKSFTFDVRKRRSWFREAFTHEIIETAYVSDSDAAEMIHAAFDSREGISVMKDHFDEMQLHVVLQDLREMGKLAR